MLLVETVNGERERMHSTLLFRLGKEIDNEDSVWYWAYKNKIPVFSPALTDGAVGEMLYFHAHKNGGKGIKLDIVEDVCLIDNMAVNIRRSVAIFHLSFLGAFSHLYKRVCSSVRPSV